MTTLTLIDFLEGDLESYPDFSINHSAKKIKHIRYLTYKEDSFDEKSIKEKALDVLYFGAGNISNIDKFKNCTIEDIEEEIEEAKFLEGFNQRLKLKDSSEKRKLEDLNIILKKYNSFVKNIGKATTEYVHIKKAEEIVNSLRIKIGPYEQRNNKQTEIASQSVKETNKKLQKIYESY